MIRSRIYYWSCSKLADFIRGTNKPSALGWNEWETWKKNLQKERPIRFWVAEKFLNKLQNFVMFPYDVYNTVRIYIRNRYFDQTHVLNTGLKAGEYYDLDTRILHALFNELVIFVETELACLSRWDEKKEYEFKNGRCEQAGLDYLDWAISLVYDESYGTLKGEKDYGERTTQAIAASKTKELYLWWKYDRPARPDPLVAAGYYEEEDIDDEIFGEMTKKRLQRAKACARIEEKYEREDTNKLIELIKNRGSLWT